MSNFVVVAIILSSLVVSSLSFSPVRDAGYRHSSNVEMSAFSDAMQSKLTKAVTIAIVANALVLSPLNVFAPIQNANADVRAQQKRTYFRFVPKLIIGRDFYKVQVKDAIDKEDWPVIKTFFAEFVSKYNPNDPTQVDATGKINQIAHSRLCYFSIPISPLLHISNEIGVKYDLTTLFDSSHDRYIATFLISSSDSYINVNLYRPMTVFSGSFAERGSSPKQKALMDQEVAFEKVSI